MKSKQMDLANISHHGAVNGVTGSCHELHIDDKNSILIDCGLFQGAETSPGGSKHDQLAIDFSLKTVQALVVTHVHIDHVGRIPYLLAAGFKGPIYCSQATALLLPDVLEDAVKIGFTKNRQLIDKFIRHIKSLLVPLDYAKNTTIELKNSAYKLAISLKPAGHILGSAYVECVIESMEKQRLKVLFSGDLGAPYAPLLAAPKSPYGCDQLVIESTYGDKNHADRRYRQKYLQSVIERAVADRGVVLIPAFSIGRTQELLYELENIIHRQSSLKESLWQGIEIIVDSPLANEFTEKYQQLSVFWDAEAQKRLKQGRHPLDFSQLLTINDHKTHLQTVAYLQKTARPTIVIAASGMCSGGRIVNYLQALISDKRTDILFTGYQARGTAGRDIQKYGRGGYVYLGANDGAKEAGKEGKKYTIEANIHTLSAYSAHADQTNLFNFVKRMRNKPRQIRLIHGDNEAKQALQKKYISAYPAIDVMIPVD
ncbi:MBL fold metallo-hydrolase RNA specificity domain-containing protein [sulfur-oxidizing endosymbiont of Gigantopelta aegis]|uniref:MBL fold metallo-hydrolase RNA specificity domain-containing protein n=1 Tax=sulfur-oxidizing endosymbiont of Gigantopelta aegis TaxID=2794934 RepID=UPI003CCCBA0B